MKIYELSGNYEVTAAGEKDIPDILRLCRGNPMYYRYCPPEVSEESIREDMVKLPPNKGREDKLYLCFRDGDRLAAVMDLILKYPNEKTAFIGFFMVDSEVQGKGVGSRIAEDVFSRLKREFSSVRLGYVRGNEQSRHFWEKNGFAPTGIVLKEEKYEIVVMEKNL